MSRQKCSCTQVKQNCKKEKFEKEAERSLERENREKSEFWFQKKFKNFSSVVVSLVWWSRCCACAYFIRGKYIRTTLITNTHVSTRAFSERERERKECVNNGNANASFVSTNDATKIDAKQQHSKIIVEKENI